jgi:four helix bundle protein
MAQSYRDLIVWQLARELRLHVLRMTRAKWGSGDRDLVSDIRRSVRSVAANTAEGHARFSPADFRRFLEIAKASLDETENHLKDGLESGLFTRTDYEGAHSLVKRITVAMMRLMNYLRSNEAKENAKRARRARSNR